jgi:origin recognition complex subunit 1
VRSIVAELQTEQYKGLLPEFNFISLNGMELRHPFDAYIKLWEAISGTKKERLTAGDSVYELENYFCGDQKGGSSHSDSEDEISRLEDEGDFDVTERPVTVLMLDEIDYLITKKETLVYNFFDWPLRGKHPITREN